jgi:hypothetical protein
MPSVGESVLVHSIGPGGVFAKVVQVSGQRIKIKYYDARDGGDIIRWITWAKGSVC